MVIINTLYSGLGRCMPFSFKSKCSHDLITSQIAEKISNFCLFNKAEAIKGAIKRLEDHEIEFDTPKWWVWFSNKMWVRRSAEGHFSITFSGFFKVLNLLFVFFFTFVRFHFFLCLFLVYSAWIQIHDF